MFVTWEDRLERGEIDEENIVNKPDLGFEYAWFLMDDDTAQFVRTHEEGVYNVDMTEEQKTKVLNFYNNYVFKGTIPAYDVTKFKLVDNGYYMVDGKKIKKYELVALSTDKEIYKTKTPSNITVTQLKKVINVYEFEDRVANYVKINSDFENLWNHGATVDRYDPVLLTFLKDNLKLTDFKIDEIFIKGSLS